MATITVQEGDTAKTLGSALGISFDRLQRFNPGVDLANLAPGTQINLPDDLAVSSGGTTDADPATAPGLLGGGITVRVPFGPGGMSDDRWYQLYELPPGSGQFVAFQFDNLQQLAQVTGLTQIPHQVRQRSWFDQNVVSEAAAEQVIGLPGQFQSLSADIMREAAQRAGIADPALLGRIASDPEMQAIMAQATFGDWTPEQVRAAQRQTSFWQETLYPGIKAFYGRTANPEEAWVRYGQNVASSLTALGYKKDADGTYNSHIGKMLDNGIDAQTFAENAPIFMQAVQSQNFFQVLRQRSQRELGKDLKFGDWFSLLKGEAAPDIQAVAEGAVVAYTAQQQGVGLGETMLQRLIAERDLSETEARNIFGEVSQAVLALGESGLRRGQLTRDDIISGMAGLSSASGLNPEEVRLRVAKIARENDLFDEEKLQFYTGFTAAGTPFKPGLTALAPESA